MSSICDCYVHYNRLINLLEEDLSSIQDCFQGEIMDAYKAIVKEEIIRVNEEIDALKKECIE